jgi:hypothetical protein
VLWNFGPKQVHSVPEPSDDSYVTIKFSKEFVESCGKAMHVLIRQSALPFLVGLAIGCSGKVGVANWLVTQPDLVD